MVQISPQERVEQSIRNILGIHFQHAHFNRIASQFAAYKRSETRLWSELTILSYKMLGGNSPTIADAAAQTELIILSLDMLDDLQDQDNFEPPWMQCDAAVALNCASNLLVAGLSGTGRMPVRPKIFELLSQAHNGQHQDLLNEVTDEEHYLAIVSAKSSSLINLAIQMGFHLLDHSDAAVEKKLDELASCIGITAQLQNDLKELTSLRSRNDLVNRKKTLAILFLLDLCETQFPMLKAYYNHQCELEELIRHKPQLVTFIRNSGVTEYTAAVQRLYIDQANRILDELPAIQPWVDQFRAIALNTT